MACRRRIDIRTKSGGYNACAPLAANREDPAEAASDRPHLANGVDPTGVMRIEWRRFRRSEHRNWISHSFLDVHLRDGSCTRYHFYGDLGMVETVLEGPEAFEDTHVYKNRIARFADFAEPLRLADIRRFAEQSSSKPYSVRNNNCHHFVRDMWNEFVNAKLQCVHYPDRFKANFLRGMVGPLEYGLSRFVSTASLASDGLAHRYEDLPSDGEASSGGGSFRSAPSRASSSSEEDSSSSSSSSTDADDQQLSRHLRLTSWRHHDGRVVGEYRARSCRAWNFDHTRRRLDFASMLACERVFLLDGDGDLVPTVVVLNAGTEGKAPLVDSWVATWLPRLPQQDGVRVAHRISTIDVLALVSELSLGSGSGALHAAKAACFMGPTLSCGSSAKSEGGSATIVADICSVVVNNAPQNELRFLLYAIVYGGQQGVSEWRRIRLLSGNALQGRERFYYYSLEPWQPPPTTTSPAGAGKACCSPVADRAMSRSPSTKGSRDTVLPCSPRPKDSGAAGQKGRSTAPPAVAAAEAAAAAVLLAESELPALRSALATGDWAFLKLA
eukprot:TRINITY_DN3489_c0_g1_i1.p1 TRINITY_DN3489_c0_g1~~TRINITY_DN3489_c0_g1_i1.p1  ORF type:complete len:556 (-),score=98.69 TRINITY_DN3489_c0_g1_i1:362-2029(-)